MKDKRGFTLVELLAVIAILAILVIIALPNVINMYNTAKKNTFLTEAKNIYQEASKKYVSSSFNGVKLSYLTSKNNDLDINNKNYEYNIKLDNKGAVSDFRVSNKNYCIKGKITDVNDLTIDDIETEYCDVFDYSPKPTDCIFDGEMVQGSEYVNGQYTYKYKQVFVGNGWNNKNLEGWGVTLTDKDSTEPVTSKVCTTINNKPIMFASSMFNGSKAVSIDLSSFNTSNVVDMGNMFNNVVATTIIGLDNFNTSKVTTMSRMFCEAKTENLDLSTFDTGNVTNMYGMFSGCAATQINGIEKFNTGKVTNMGFMFANTVLKSIDMSSFDTSNVTDMGAMFSDSKAEYLNVSSFDTSKVTSMWATFRNAKFTSLNIDNFDTSKVTNMNWMFQGTVAKELDLRKLNTGNVTSMQGMFMNSESSIIKGLENFDTKNVVDMSSMFNCSKVTRIDVSSFDTSNVKNMWGMFRFVIVPKIYGLENFNTSNVTGMAHMFSLSSLEEVDVSHFDTSNVTDMNLMFYIMNKIKTIDLSNFNIDNVTTMNEMFFGTRASVGYARNETDAARYNDSEVTRIPNTFKFIVK